MGYWPYKVLFEKYKSDCTTFLETGTYKGDSVQDAYDLGFERIVSIEVEESLYKECMERFQPLDAWEQIKLFVGRTEDNIENLVLDWTKGRTMFWLDAHKGNKFASSPYKIEIEAIMKHERNDHVIIIDDVDRPYIGENGVKWIKETLSKHNPFYKFKITQIHPECGEQLIAYI